MNKNLHRIIFNANRGQLMVVAESATGQGKDASGERGASSSGADSTAMATNTRAGNALRSICLGVLASLGGVVFTVGMTTGMSAQAQIVADPTAPGGQRPTVLNSANGVPVVNIQTPSAAGVSRNTYQQFDVNSNGAILNNSRTNVQTQLGGFVQGNPWLATGTARVILNEVNSSNPSQLRGYIEVGGQRAEVVVANPAGVSIDGAGFINTSRVTITTGNAVVNGGSLDGYLVERGQVTVNGKGLDTSSADYTTILARAVQVNGGIWAKQLNVTTGANQLRTAEGSEATVVGAATGQGPAPLFALDVSQLGGMYAGKILLIGTEAGVGVRNAGEIGASAGQVQIRPDGMLSNSGRITSAGNTVIDAQSGITNTGLIYSQGNTTLGTRGNITNTSVVAALGNVDLLASGASSQIDSSKTSALVAGLNSEGILVGSGKLSLDATLSASAQGQNLTPGDLTIRSQSISLADSNTNAANVLVIASTGDVDAGRAVVAATQVLDIRAAQTVRTDSAKISAVQLNLQARNLSNIQGDIVQTGTADLVIDLKGDVDNSQGRIAANSGNLTLSGKSLVNTTGKIEHAGNGTLALQAQTLDGTGGTITSNGLLKINAATVTTDAATISARQITIGSDTLSNRNGVINQTGSGNTEIVASTSIDNTAGKIESNGNTTLSSGSLINHQGRITSALNTAIVVSTAFDNTDGNTAGTTGLQIAGGNVNNTRGNIQSQNGSVSVTATDFSNLAGSVYSKVDLRISAATLTNSGNLYASGNQTIRDTGTVNNSGAIAAQGDLSINADMLISKSDSLLGAGVKSDGSLTNAGALVITTTSSLTANGQNLAAGSASFNAKTVDLSGSQTNAQTIDLLATGGNVVTRNAKLVTPGLLTVTANTLGTQTLDNTGGLLNAGQLNLSVSNINNTQGEIVQTGVNSTAIGLTSPNGVFNNTLGRIASNGNDLKLTANTFTNTDGRIEHAGLGKLEIDAVALNAQRGQITSNGSLTVQAVDIDHRSASTVGRQVSLTANNLDNRSGEITQLGGEQTTITVANNFFNADGKLQSNGDLTVNASTLTNSQGQISTVKNAVITTNLSLDNSSGTVAAGKNLDLKTGDLINTGGSIKAVTGNAILQATDLSNVGGSVYAGGNLSTTATQVKNSGNLYAGNDQTLSVSESVENTGVIAALGNTTVDAGSVTSRSSGLLGAGIKADGSLASSGDLSITAARGIAANGQNLAAGNLALRGSEVDLSSSQTGAKNITVTAAAGNVTTARAELVATAKLAITADIQEGQTLDNWQGFISAAQLSIQVANLDNRQAEIIQTGTGNTTVAMISPTGKLDNTQGRIAVNSENLILSANKVTNLDGRIDHAGSGNLTISALALDGQSGQIISNGALAINAGQIDHRKATATAQQIQINGGALDNREGRITQLGSTTTKVTLSQGFDNGLGVLESNGDTTVIAQSINNQAGTLRSSGSASLSISTTGMLDNSNAGNIAAGGKVSLVTGTVVNQQGRITAGGPLNTTAVGAVDNAQGLIAATGKVNLAANTFDNTRGSLASVQSDVVVTTVGQTFNNSGKIQALADVTLTNSGLSNARVSGQSLGGSITGRNVDIDTRLQAVNNNFGVIGATQAVDLRTGILNNDSGLIQGGTSVTINTHGQDLINTNAAAYTAPSGNGGGGITSVGSLSLTTGQLNNSAGYIGAIGTIAGTTGQVNNTAGGQLLSKSNIGLDVSGLDNQGGQVQALGNVTFNAGNGSINNAGSLIRSGGTIRLTAASINNSSTQGTNQGTEGDDVALTTASLNNSSGAIRADNNASVTSSGVVDNSNGLISAGNTLTVADGAAVRGLAITNTNGTLVSGSYTDLMAMSLTGGGKVLAKQDLSINLSAGYTHNAGAELSANRDASIIAAGDIANFGIINAKGTLVLDAANINNTALGDISGATTQITARDSLTNRGVIDGVITQINAGTLNNTGTGRIYGDDLSIGANTVINQREGEIAATIAARASLNIAAQTIHNTDNASGNPKRALIFSVGGLRIGENLDANRIAQGSAGTLSNESATIEALGEMTISASQVINLNNNFATQVVPVSSNSLNYWVSGRPIADPQRLRVLSGTFWELANINIAYDGQVFYLQSPDGQTDNYFQYDINRSVQQTVVSSSNPGKIIASGPLSINANTIKNDNSELVSGGALNLNAVLINDATAGQRTTTDIGTVTNIRRVKQGGRDRSAFSTSPYAPPATVEITSLSESRVERYTAPAGSDTVLADANVSGTNATTSAASSAVANVNPTVVNNISNGLNAVGNAVGPNAVGAQSPAGFSNTNLVGTAGLTIAVGSASGSQTPTATANNGSVQARINPINQVALANPTGGVQVVRTTVTPAQVPGTSLFKVNPAPRASFLVETDPRFASYRQWLSSDYFLSQVQLDPAVTQKRLGDGFYEQMLIREQVAQLTGSRFLGNFTNDEAQYRALINAGVTYAAEYNLRPGIALSPAQMAQLTADIVWLVEQSVTLPNGQTVKVLMPQVYVRVRPGDVNGTGALIAGREVNINSKGDVVNTGTIAGRNVVSLTAENVNNLGGRISGDSVAVNARNDLNNIGGSISANSQLAVSAGRDINVTSTTRSATSAAGANSFSRTWVDRVAGLYVTGDGASSTGVLTASAGRDVNLMAGVISNNAKDGSTNITATRNINLGAVTTASSNSLAFDAGNSVKNANSRELGSTVTGVGSISLNARQDINLKAANVDAGKALVVVAGNNVNIAAGQDTDSFAANMSSSSKGLLSKSSTTTRDTNESTTAAGSRLGGDTVVISAGNNLTVRGSEVIGDNATTLVATNNLTIEAAQNTSSTTSFRSESKSGLFSNGGLSVTIGKKQNSTDQKEQGTTAAASTVGSINGNVNLIAGQTYRQVGSDILAPTGDINILAKDVQIIEARETTATQTETKTKQSGLTVAISSPVLSAAQSIQGLAKASGNTSSSRAKGLAAAGAGLTGYTAYNGLTDKAGKFDASKAADINVSISLGSSKSQSNSNSTSNTARGSTVNAGGNVNITATGAGQASNILIQGSDIKAGNNASLTADNQINLLAAKNESSNKTTNSSSSGSIGMSLGSNTGVTVAASKGKGKSNGADTIYTNTTLTAGNTATLKSGGNTAVKGAVVSANQIKADIGGSLTIESLQDKSTYSSSQKSAGGSITFGPGGIPTGGSISASKSKINSNFESVNEQSGLKAGDGGFQVSVANNTSLTGGVISSSQAAVDGKVNTFTTGGNLTITDVQNTASYKGTAVGGTIGVGSQLGSSGAGVGNMQGSAASTSSAGISGIAGNTAVRTGDAETGIKPIFNADTVQKDIDAQVKITTAFGQQAIPAAAKFADNKAIALRQQGNEAEAAKWDEKGIYRTAMYGGIGFLTGGKGGATGAMASATIVPTIGEEIARLNLPEPVRQGLTQLVGLTVGATLGGTGGAATALPQTAFNYVSHSPFDSVRKTVSKENARLLNECGANCTLADFRRIDLQMQKVEAAGNLVALAEGSQLTPAQSKQATQLMLELMPVTGSVESLMQLVTGKQSVTGEQADRFWAAVGVLPAAGGMLRRVGAGAEDVYKAFNAADKVADVAKRPGLINDANRLFRQYADDIETQTGYRLTATQRAELAIEMRTGNHAVTLNPAENKILRDQFNAQLPQLRAEWSRQTGQAWPQVTINGVSRNADAHHAIPVANAGPTVWWNITPAAGPAHRAIHAPGSPLNQLQTGVR